MMKPTKLENLFVAPCGTVSKTGRVYGSFHILTYFASFCHLEQTIPAKTTINATCGLDLS